MIKTVGQDLRGLIKVLGLPKNTTWFELRVATNETVTIKCGYVPDINDTNNGELEEVLAEYELRLIEDESRAETYAADNRFPLTATTFEVIAGRIRAGEDYQSVIDDYGIKFDF